MKTKNLILIAFVIIMGFISSCNCIQGTGPIVSEKRDVANFSEIELDLNADIYLVQDTTVSLTFEAQENLINYIRTDVSRDKLRLYFKENCYLSDETIRFYISLRELSGITVDGSGVIDGNGAFSSEVVDLDINGSGKIMLNLVANKIDIDINGSGSIYLKGSSQKMKCDINGSGNVYASDHTAYKAFIDVSGSGDCEVYVHDLLDANITGSGSVYYSGNPEIQTHVKGSGSVMKR